MKIDAQGLTETSQWLGRLAGEIEGALESEITSPSALAQMQADAQQIVATVVYAAYSPSVYQRTFELISAVGAIKFVDKPPAAAVVIELTPGVTANDGQGDISYAQFMLPEMADRSWLRRTVPESIPRDFLLAWQQYFADQIPAKVSHALDEALRK